MMIKKEGSNNGRKKTKMEMMKSISTCPSYIEQNLPTPPNYLHYGVYFDTLLKKGTN